MTIKRLCISIAALMIFALQGVAQNTIEAINEIKLSGKYFTAEATAPNQDEATNQAMGNLRESIGNYCEEMEIEEVGEDRIKANLLQKTISRGDAVMVLVYVPKTIVKKDESAHSNANASAPPTTSVSTTPSSTSSTVASHWPDIIKRVSEVETFAQLQYLLIKAVDNNLIAGWGKFRNMTNPDACYLVMMNADRQIVGVLAPVKNGVRINVKTGSGVDSEGMKSFANCAPICVRIK